MNDRQLHDELERRRGKANVNRDWARRELLPAVSAAIETRPQKVATSRGPAFAGLAGAAAMLLILVVALPRFASAPPATGQASGRPSGTSAPDPIQPQILTAQEFAVGVLTGRLRSSTVLVDGTIGARPSLDGPGCHVSPPESCLMGRLEGTDPSVDVLSSWIATDERDPSVPASDEMWAWWHLPSGPITGTLLLSVNGDGVIEFLGQVDAANTGRAITVAEANQVDVVSVDLGNVVLVEGWLWTPEGPGEFIDIDCIGPAPRLPGLPSRYCQPTSSIVSEFREPGTRGELGRSAQNIGVQRGAYQTFGVKTPGGPRVFAIAPRLYGECYQVAPCWEWDVVGRLSDTSPVDPSPAPLPNTIRCGPATTADETSQIATARPTIIDETGLVESCEIWDAQLVSEKTVLVTNPDEDQSVLQVHWSGTPCDMESTFLFSTVPDGYLLDGRRPGGGCIQPLFHHAMRIHLMQSVHAASVTASLLPAGVPFASSAATPPAPATAGRVVECADVSTDPQPANPWMAYQATVVDSTALVIGCRILDASAAEVTRPNRIAVSNGPSGHSELHLTWASGSWCGDASSEVRFRPVGGRYEIRATDIPRESEVPCVGGGPGHALALDLLRDVPADLVDAINLGAPDNSPPAPPPTGPPLIEPQIIDCDGAPDEFSNGDVRLKDHTGLASTCAGHTDRGVPTGELSVSAREDGALLVAWPVVLDNCTPMDSVLELWREPQPTSQGYVLAIRMSSPNTEPPDPQGPMCDAATGLHSAVISLSQELDPADVNAFQMIESADVIRGSTYAQALDGWFELSLSTPTGGLTANQPLDELQASLTYQGGQSAAVLHGGGPPRITWTQLDGQLTFYPYGTLLFCTNSATQLDADGELASTFTRPSEPATYDPNRAYYDEYMPDGKFRLPAGTYLVTTLSSFFLEPECAGEHVRLRTSIVIEVR